MNITHFEWKLIFWQGLSNHEAIYLIFWKLMKFMKITNHQPLSGRVVMLIYWTVTTASLWNSPPGWDKATSTANSWPVSETVSISWPWQTITKCNKKHTCRPPQMCIIYIYILYNLLKLKYPYYIYMRHKYKHQFTHTHDVAGWIMSFVHRLLRADPLHRLKLPVAPTSWLAELGATGTGIANWLKKRPWIDWII